MHLMIKFHPQKRHPLFTMEQNNSLCAIISSQRERPAPNVNLFIIKLRDKLDGKKKLLLSCKLGTTLLFTQFKLLLAKNVFHFFKSFSFCLGNKKTTNKAYTTTSTKEKVDTGYSVCNKEWDTVSDQD